MVEGSYDQATKKVEVWQKDLQIIGDFARELACPTPLFAASAQLYAAAQGQGRAKQDTAAVCAVLEEMAPASDGRSTIDTARFSRTLPRW